MFNYRDCDGAREYTGLCRVCIGNESEKTKGSVEQSGFTGLFAGYLF